MSKKLITISGLTILLTLPLVSLAFSVPTQPTQGLILVRPFLDIIVNVVWWAFLAGVVIFLIIIAVLLLSSQGNPEDVAKGRRALIWAGVGIIVGLLAFGMVRVIMTTFGL